MSGEPIDVELRAMAHDIRNALFGVSMNIELVLEVAQGDSDPIRERAIANARTEIARISAIADALTALARRTAARDAPPP